MPTTASRPPPEASSSDDQNHRPPAAPTQMSAPDNDESRAPGPQSSPVDSDSDGTTPSPSSASSSSSSSSPSSRLFSQFYNHSSSSSSSSSSSNSNSNPLLPSLPTSTASILASRYDPSLPYFQSGSSSHHSEGEPGPSSSQMTQQQQQQQQQQPRMPEKCFSFCTQSDNARPMCRMLCLRKRAPELTREEQLKRLRPPALSKSPHSLVHTSSTSNSDTAIASSSSSSSASTSYSTITSYLSAPFEALRRKVEPYSIIYVRGSPDGVVGRYMEELEWDDGEYDFGAISRGGATAAGKRKKEGEEKKYDWIDWGDHGSVLYMPLKTIFNPVTSIPSTLNTLLTPSFNLLRFYSNSFTDGSQSRSLEKLTHEIQRGGALEMLGKLRGYWEKRVQETKEKRDQMLREANNAGAGAGARAGAEAGRDGRDRVKDVGKEVEGKGE